jgi:hypothetical protein
LFYISNPGPQFFLLTSEALRIHKQIGTERHNRKQLNKNLKYDILSLNHIHPMLRMFTKDKVRFVNISDNKIHTWMTAAFPVFLLLAFSLHAKAQTASARMVESCKEFNELNTNKRWSRSFRQYRDSFKWFAAPVHTASLAFGSIAQ